MLAAAGLLFLAVFALALNASAPLQADTYPLIRAHLKRGINLENWFRKADGRSIEAQQMAELAALGFDHVRIPVSPRPIETSRDATCAKLIAAVGALNAAGLAVIVDLHAGSGRRGGCEP